MADDRDFVPEPWRRSGSVVGTKLAGQPNVFGPIGPLGSWWTHDPAAGSPSLYATKRLHNTLVALVDYDLLIDPARRFAVVAVDVMTGEEIVFDTAQQTLGADHVRASGALLTTFPAVEIEGRLLGDGGLSMNLPLDPVFEAADEIPTLCIAADLLALSARRPATPGEVVGRMQDLMFTAQSRRTIERWQAVHTAREADAGPRPPMTIVRIEYSDQHQEVAGKAMDFSPASVRHRWAAGYADTARIVERLRSGDIPVGQPGITVATG